MDKLIQKAVKGMDDILYNNKLTNNKLNTDKSALGKSTEGKSEEGKSEEGKSAEGKSAESKSAADKLAAVNLSAIKSYKKDYDYSYTLGAFPSIEMIKVRPECIKAVYMHTSFNEKDMLSKLCNEKGIILLENDKVINRLSTKENVFVAGVFIKYNDSISDNKPHIVLVNPKDMGNLGTIIRTAVGFGIKDIAVICPGADIFHPKVIRSSMGSIFRLRHENFGSFEEYRKKHPKHEVFTFMLNAKNQLMADSVDKPELFSLVFGNEASGLDDSFLEAGTSLMIPQSPEVDSLNLTIAVGIGTYLFTRGK